MFKKKWFIGVLLGVVIVALVLLNFRNAGSAATVKTAEVTEGKIIEHIYSNGRLEPQKTIAIFSPVGGIVQTLNVKVGDSVTKGQPLLKFKIDTVKEQIEKEKIAIEVAEANRLVAKKQHYEKFKEQMSEDPDQTIEELNVTSFDLQIRSSKLNIASLEKQLNNSTVYASADGVVTEVFVKEGQIMAEGSQVVSVADLSSYKVKSNLNEMDAGKIGLGMKAVITGEPITGTYNGEVTYLSPTAVLSDKTSKDATVEMELTLSSTADELRPGYNVTIDMELSDKDRILVPISAVKYEGAEVYVFKVEGEKAVKSIVTIGKEGEEQIEIVSGVAKGDKVVVEGAESLRDGDKVKVQ